MLEPLDSANEETVKVWVVVAIAPAASRTV